MARVEAVVADPQGAPAAARSSPAAARAPVAWGAAILVGLAGVALLAAHARGYSFARPDGPRLFLSDDALISLRYADRLATGHGLTWNDGERVEGYSNFLWVLLVAALRRCGVDAIVAARVLGGVCTSAVVASVVAAYPPRSARGSRLSATAAAALPSLAGALGLAASAPIAIWAIGGLEQPLLAALVAWAVVLLFPVVDRDAAPSPRRVLVPGLLLGLAVLTRPDAPLFTAAACAGLVAVRGLDRTSLRLAATLAALPLLFYVGHLAFRLAYYGDWVPNSAHAKLAFSWARASTGLAYAASGCLRASPLFALAAAALFAARAGGRRRGHAVLASGVALAWTGYVALVGGDIFPGWRHLVVVIALAAILAAGGVEQLVERRGGRTAIVGAGVLAATGALFWMQDAIEPESQARARAEGRIDRLDLAEQLLVNRNALARDEEWEWDGEAIGTLLRRAFGARKALLATDSAGCLPYFSGLPSIDMLGINDRFLATHPPEGFGRGWAGHELGDGRYVLERRPDLVVFVGPLGGLHPYFRSGKEMRRDPSFLPSFQPVAFETGGPQPLRSVIWVRREGGAVGIRRTAERVIVPGFFFVPARELGAPRSEDPGAEVGLGLLGPGDAIGGRVGAGAPSVLPRLALEPGTWTLTLSPASEEVRLAVRTRAGGEEEPGAGPWTVTIPPGAPASIEVVATSRAAAGTHVASLVLERSRD